MAKFAIIKIGPFQYNVEEGKQYSVPNFEAEIGKPFNVTEVLAVGDDAKLEYGKPFLDKASVELEIVDQAKGDKVVSKIFKAKSRYRRKRGHRKLETVFKVKKIS